MCLLCDTRFNDGIFLVQHCRRFRNCVPTLPRTFWLQQVSHFTPNNIRLYDTLNLFTRETFSNLYHRVETHTYDIAVEFSFKPYSSEIENYFTNAHKHPYELNCTCSTILLILKCKVILMYMRRMKYGFPCARCAAAREQQTVAVQPTTIV